VRSRGGRESHGGKSGGGTLKEMTALRRESGRGKKSKDKVQKSPTNEDNIKNKTLKGKGEGTTLRRKKETATSKNIIGKQRKNSPKGK